ncbi:MAG: zf-HC2 domain-containing protein [Eubacterium sp.]|nr:zf-HC2 domain-containing protein [Eubacterium sp.]
MDKDAKVNETTKLSCAVVQDLLPLYYDGVVREETAHEVDVHMEDCVNCKKAYEELCQENNLLLSQQMFQDSHIEEEKNGFNAFMKKNRRKGMVTGIVSVCITVAIIVLFVWYTYNIGLNIVQSKNLIITYEKESEDEFVVWCDLKNNREEITYLSADGRYLEVKRGLGHWYGMTGACYFMYDEDTGERIVYTDEDILQIECSDKTIEVNLREVAEELGLQ